jgi:RNA polymerase sigma factor (TIGR02999 family)
MPPVRQATVTALLTAWSEGDASALDHLVPIVYAELHNLARRHMRAERRGHAVQTTVLVHEAYVRLASSRGLRCKDRVHFYALCAGIMRRILVDIARREHARKRGGNAGQLVLDERLTPAPERGPDIEAVDDAVTALATVNHRQARIVELRYFGGLSVEETAGVMRLSRATVLREWKAAKQWLLHQLTGRDAVRRAERS